MNRKEIILERISNETLMFADGLDDAIIGICETTNRVIYSTKKVLEILTNEGMEYEDALEHFGFNITNGYVGEMTPIFCDDRFFE
jgi:hypothetical protein